MADTKSIQTPLSVTRSLVCVWVDNYMCVCVSVGLYLCVYGGGLSLGG